MNKIINAYDIMKSIIFYMVKKLEKVNLFVLFMELTIRICLLYVTMYPTYNDSSNLLNNNVIIIILIKNL